MSRYLTILLAATLVGCTTIVWATIRPSGDTKNWIAYRIEVGGQVVKFTIPPGVNEEFLDPPIPEQIDLEQPNLFNQTGLGPTLLERHWDYKASMEQVDGTLHAYIGLWRSGTILDSNDALRVALKQNKELLRAKDISVGGSGGPPDVMQFEPAIVGGRSGLLLDHQTSLSDYAVVLDNHHYLTIGIDASSFTHAGWGRDAEAAAQAIFKSIRIEPRSGAEP